MSQGHKGVTVIASVFVTFVFGYSAFVPVGALRGAPRSEARSGAIRGRVELRKAPTPVERRPPVADVGAPAARDLPDLLRSVVYLESAPRGAFETTAGGHAIMDQ